ncbi:hypothetical protein AB3S75_028076 [Citrus x aurantiifolia]
MPIDENSSYRLVILFWSAFNLIDKFQWLSELAKRYYGPFRVSEQIGAVAYKLQLPEGCKVHPVFHISALKPYVGSSTVYVASLPPDTIDNKPVSTPIAILADRFILKQGKKHYQILVQWSGCAPENSTWEDFAEFCRLYPEFNLEDKVHSQGEGSDRSWPIKVRELEDGPVVEMQEVEQTLQRPARVRKTPEYLKDYIT